MTPELELMSGIRTGIAIGSKNENENENETETETTTTTGVASATGPRVAVAASHSKSRQLRDERDAIELIGQTRSLAATWVAIPLDLLTPEFFDLRTGVAGAILQKFAQYSVGLALVGDYAAHAAASTALRDLIRESNRGRACWFVASLDELRDRMARHDS